MLHQTAFNSLPLRAIKPAGWLKDQLEIQASGFTGHLEEQWKDVGADNGWLGGQGESWERGPYYVDGLLPLAYLLEDESLIAKANRWVEWSLASQQENGMFGPARITSVNQDIDKDQDWWHYMIMLKVMMQHEEATGDERIIPFLTKFFTYVHSVIEEQPLRGWAKTRGPRCCCASRGCINERRSLSCCSLRIRSRNKPRTGAVFFMIFRSGARLKSGIGQPMS